MLKAIIVDDEDNITEALAGLLNLYHADVKICARCNSVSSAIAAIKAHQPNIVFLDVELGEESGFDIFKHFSAPAFKVVFITAHQQYAVQAFRFAALDYLLKPVQSNLLAEALQKISSAIDGERFNLKLNSFLHNMSGALKSDKKIILKTAENVHLVSLSDIMYCEADGGYTNFHLADNSRIMVSSTMGTYEDLFTEYGFFRIHQTYLLNLGYFKRYEKADGGKAILKNNAGLPVATRKKDQLLQKLGELQ